MSTDTHYAECLDCDEKFTSRDEMLAHLESTNAPSHEPGIISSGHTCRLTNPEVSESRRIVVNAVESGIDAVLDQLWRAIDRGEATEEEVTKEVASYDCLSEAWQESVEANS